MKKGEIYEGVITAYDFPNKGSLTFEDRKVTVKGALLGQKVRFMITKKKSGMAEGKLLCVLEKSPLEDAEPVCPYFGMCGGCAYQTMSYENQLKVKEDMVKKLIGRFVDGSVKSGEAIGGNEYNAAIMEDVGGSASVWEGIIAAPLTYEYRNKMEFTFGDEYKDGPLSLGLHKKGGFYDILKVSQCKIIKKEWGRILDYTCEFFKEKNVPFYHKMRHEGILRNLVVRQSFATGEFLVNLVAATQWGKYGFDEEAVLKEFTEGLVSLADDADFCGGIAGILYTENNSLGDVVACDSMKLLYGSDYIIEEILGLKFKISPFSFFQTNTKGCEMLYEKAREYILSGSVMKGLGKVVETFVEADMSEGDLAREKLLEWDLAKESINGGGVSEGNKDKIVFDLYSGTGTIAQMMAPVAKKVIGIEIVEEAVLSARENAKLNGLDNCEFIAGDVLKAIDLVDEKPDVIILDPPRDGINPKALEKILAFGVKEMVYISCKPTSLARDLEIIIGRGYEVKRACAVDEFPGTGHVETVCLLSNRKPDARVKIDVDLEDYYRIKDEQKKNKASE